MNQLICGENLAYSMKCFETQLTNNLLVIGATGSGKSRSIIGPNIVQCHGSQIIFDPKGALYKLYAPYLYKSGYVVKKLDFTNPKHSCHYNPFLAIQTTQEVSEIAHALVYTKDTAGGWDPFWTDSAKQLLCGLIAIMNIEYRKSEMNFKTLVELLAKMEQMEEEENGSEHHCELDDIVEQYCDSTNAMEAFAYRCYTMVNTNPCRTLRCVLTTLSSKLNAYITDEILELTSYTDFDVCSFGNKKTAFFVVCSDAKGASLDRLVQLFFSQTMNQLVDYADTKCKGQRLNVPVQFIMDDFACGVSIQDFHKKIAIVRSRNISVCIAIQAVQQLEDLYGPAAATIIISNFDTTVFMGCNDVRTCDEFARRINKPLADVLNMPIGYSWVCRRGSKPVFTKNATPINVAKLTRNAMEQSVKCA